jgi:hypothetical protein
MTGGPSNFLTAGAVYSAIAGLVHLGIIFGGASWYRFFGAGEKMALASAAGRWQPALMTFAIAVTLFVWSAYALSGVGYLLALPWRKWILVAVTAIYLLRGLVVIPWLFTAHAHSRQFIVVSSVISLMIGLVHLLGLIHVWTRI